MAEKIPEEFDPKDAQYKKVEDLPEEHKDEFVDVSKEMGGGFVKEEAKEIHNVAQKASDIIWRVSARENLLPREQIREIAKDLSSMIDGREKLDEILKKNPELRDDEEVMLSLIMSGTSHAPRQASERLRNDKHFALEAVKRNGRALGYLSNAMRDDEEVVLVAVKQSGFSLEYASERLRDNEEIVREAVRQGGTFSCASERLRNRKDLILERVMHGMSADSYQFEVFKNIPVDILLDDDFLVTVGANPKVIRGLESDESGSEYPEKASNLVKKRKILDMIREAEGRKKQEENK